jgi:hypothetical protein
MAERIVSPGVFTNEKDQSFLPIGISQIGAAIIGPTTKGPAQLPTQITSFSEFEEMFGSHTEDSYIPFTVEQYLKNAGVVTVTRLLYEGGYELSNGALAVIAESGSTKIITHLLHPAITALPSGSAEDGDYFEDSVINDLGSGSFAIRISGSAGKDINVPGYTAYTTTDFISSSINPDQNNYIGKIFGTNPKTVDYPTYIQYENNSALSSFDQIGHVTMSLGILDSYKFKESYKECSTPFITSQKITGGASIDLFKFHTLSHGTAENYDVKVGIRDIRLASEVADPNGYGTFTVEVRRVNNENLPNSPFISDDTDKQPEVVESYVGCNLDPSSPNYIARRIGDNYREIDNDTGKIYDKGTYPNLSKYIRVEVTQAVTEKVVDKSSIPFGFRAPFSPIPSGSLSTELYLDAISYQDSQTIGSLYSSRNYHGFDYTNVNNLNYLAPIPTAGAVTGSNQDFYLGSVNQSTAANFPNAVSPYTSSLQASLEAGTFTDKVSINTRKFMTPMQGGFDGAKPNLAKYRGKNIVSSNTFGFDCSTATSTGTAAYRTAFAALSNTDFFDINMLVTPGILNRLHPIITEEARELVEDRQDTFYVMDSNAVEDSISTIINDVNSIDSNYTSTYYPWVRINNPANNRPEFVPPSVVVPGALSFSDAVAAPWYAPAGLNRGGLGVVTDTYDKLSQSDRDDLYLARINPIANFPNEGVCIWGQKTLQARPSALDRVNVRRLLITVKKFIASATRYLVFEQNTDATRNRFLAIANPYLESVKAQQGLYAFRVVMDETNNTPDLIDQNILYGQIFLQPTRTAEFIVLDFNIQATGASFPE